MGKNIKGGSKHKKFKRNRDSKVRKINLKMLIKEDEQEYAYVKDLLGDCRVRVVCWDKRERLGIIRGKMRKRCWIAKSDIVLITLREFEDDKCDIIQKYDSEQIKALVKKGEFTNVFAKNGDISTFESDTTYETDAYDDDDSNFFENSNVDNTQDNFKNKEEITTDDLELDWDTI